jgi:hypothetical protein
VLHEGNICFETRACVGCGYADPYSTRDPRREGVRAKRHVTRARSEPSARTELGQGAGITTRFRTAVGAQRVHADQQDVRPGLRAVLCRALAAPRHPLRSRTTRRRARTHAIDREWGAAGGVSSWRQDMRPPEIRASARAFAYDLDVPREVSVKRARRSHSPARLQRGSKAHAFGPGGSV